MVKLNANLKNLKKNYLFVDIQNKAKDYISKNPAAQLISMGIGDVTLPLSPVITKAMQDASREMNDAKNFRGYGPYEGYNFLREAISKKYLDYGVEVKAEEIYVSDGAKSGKPGLRLRRQGPGKGHQSLRQRWRNCLRIRPQRCGKDHLFPHDPGVSP